MVIISFANTRHGLVVPDAHGYLYGFELAGEDQRYFPARAAIRGGQVEVQSSDVSAPKYIRYAWADNPRANLYNAEGLPAAPFRRALAP
jgi:sialate O-acetylesterase